MYRRSWNEVSAGRGCEEGVSAKRRCRSRSEEVCTERSSEEVRDGGKCEEEVSALRLLCAAGGSLLLPELLHLLRREGWEFSEDSFCGMVLRCGWFLRLAAPAEDGLLRAEDYRLVARSALRLCREYALKKPCSGSCARLHLCRHWVYGTCMFSAGRTCDLSHDLLSDQNLQVVSGQNLEELQWTELQVLLRQNDPWLLPEVCRHYNRGVCSFATGCTKLHVCAHFLRGDYKFGLRCQRLHLLEGAGPESPCLEEAGRRLLEDRGINPDDVPRLRLLYANAMALRAETEGRSAEDDGAEICLHFIRGSCRFKDSCRLVHFLLPYRWQVLDGDFWSDLEDMEDIERDYSDPANTHSGGLYPVDFLSMTLSSRTVRRLSTPSSVSRPPHYCLTTRWCWYYRGEQGRWVEFGQPDERQRCTSVTSETLETIFQSDRREGSMEVEKGGRSYILSFQDMYLRNRRHNTKRKVRRRPLFISRAQLGDQGLNHSSLKGTRGPDVEPQHSQGDQSP